ncbi:hypothetical protein ACFL3U_04565 [Pseudomonadota bacterium]
MVSSLPISNYLVPRVSQPLAQQPAHEKPTAHEQPEENNRSLPEKIPQILDLEASKQMEKRLAFRAQQGIERENYALQAQQAVKAYETLAADEERDRVSGMLGIDVFA